MRSVQGRTIFVGGLSIDASDADLTEYFSSFGRVVSSTVRVSCKGKSKRFGFVTFDSRSAAQQATAHRVHIILNKMATVETAQEPSNKILALQSKVARKLYLGSIPAATDKPQLVAALSGYGVVEKITRLRTKDDHTMYCYVVMESQADAAFLLELGRVRFSARDWLVVRPFIPQLFAREELEQKSRRSNFKLTGATPDQEWKLSDEEGPKRRTESNVKEGAGGQRPLGSYTTNLGDSSKQAAWLSHNGDRDAGSSPTPASVGSPGGPREHHAQPETLTSGTAVDGVFGFGFDVVGRRLPTDERSSADNYRFNLVVRRRDVDPPKHLGATPDFRLDFASGPGHHAFQKRK